jgi:hypothetical protein
MKEPYPFPRNFPLWNIYFLTIFISRSETSTGQRLSVKKQQSFSAAIQPLIASRSALSSIMVSHDERGPAFVDGLGDAESARLETNCAR